jgi:hypothetical protein
MKQFVAFVVLLAFVTAGGSAQEKRSGVPAALTTVTLKGYIVDQMCAQGMQKRGNPMQKAAAHTKECALEENCSASGFGLFSDGKWYVFDEAGSRKAHVVMEKEKREKGLSYEVTGTLEGNKLAVASIKETKLEAKPEKKSE